MGLRGKCGKVEMGEEAHARHLW